MWCITKSVPNTILLSVIYTMEKGIQEKYLKLVGERLRELRISAGFKNYEHFAYSHGLSRAQYGRYENGANMTFTTLLRLIEIHDITLNAFFDSRFSIARHADDS